MSSRTSMELAAAKAKAKVKKTEYERSRRAYKREVDFSFAEKERTYCKKYNDFRSLAVAFVRRYPQQFASFVAVEKRPLYAEAVQPSVNEASPPSRDFLPPMSGPKPSSSDRRISTAQEIEHNRLPTSDILTSLGVRLD
jgi:hypothetical protein